MSDDEAHATVSLVPDRIETARETAYRLWCTECGQNATAVARVMNIPVRTVQNWSLFGNWREQWRADKRAIARSAVVKAETALVGALADAAQSLARIARGEHDQVTILTKKGELASIDFPVPYQARVNAYLALRDTLGITPDLIASVDNELATDETDPNESPSDRQRRLLQRALTRGNP